MDETIEPQEGMNPEPEVVEETVDLESTETPESDEPEVVPKSQYDEVHRRAKKAEADLKALRGNSPAPKKPQQASSPADVDERILLSQGMHPELLKVLKKVSSVQGVGLIEAQTDDIFVAVKEKFESEQKAKKASVPASRGSGAPIAKKDFRTPGLTEAEHRKMVQSLK